MNLGSLLSMTEIRQLVKIGTCLSTELVWVQLMRNPKHRRLSLRMKTLPAMVNSILGC